MSYAERIDEWWRGSPLRLSTTLYPIGYDADAEIAAKDAEIERLQKREAHLFEALKRCERDVQRALREGKATHGNGNVAYSGSPLCPYRTACEAIQQRAAGLREE